MENLKYHIPVLLTEVLEYLNPASGEIFIDCTFGAGGYTKAILEKTNCKVIAIDRDINVKPFADNLKEKFKDRFEFHNIKYSEVESILNERKVDGIVLDVGISSMQVDNAERGFSFQKNSKLNMSMGNSSLTAYEIINNTPEKELADIIYNYGDEVKSRHIARKIVELRTEKPIETTFELAEIVRNFYRGKEGKIDPATKTFQAIRIAVNEELDELKKILEISKKILKKDGRLVVVSFHSLEDKIVKDFTKNETDKGKKVDKYSNKKQIEEESKNDKKCEFELLTKKAIPPSKEEIQNNVRSRSAKLRGLKKC